MADNCTFQVTSSVLCEGIRQEVNNKYGLYGIFSGSILFQKFPATVVLAVYLELEGLEPGKHKIEFRYQSPGASLGGGGEIFIAAPGPAALPLPALPVICNETGEFEAQLKFDDGEWTTVLRRNVSLGQFSENGILTSQV